MDSAKIRSLMTEWFAPRPGNPTPSADEDYAEAASAIKALKCLFLSELERRESGTGSDGENTNEPRR